MSIRPEVLPFWSVSLLIGLLWFLIVYKLLKKSLKTACWQSISLTVLLVVYLGFFFRDPDRIPPSDPSVIVAAADGRIAQIKTLDDSQFRAAAGFCGLNQQQVDRFLKGGKVIRISIFLSLFDVHVNRAPFTGMSEFLGYFPGKHFFTFTEKSSDHNQHNSILISNDRTVCLINQIVGPVCRRVVYWPDHDKATPLQIGDRIGMMKFGSRLDMYFPANEISLNVELKDKVRAGETIIGRIISQQEAKP